MTDKEPVWPYRMPLKTAQWFCENFVVSIEWNTIWESEDSWHNDIIVKSDEGKSISVYPGDIDTFSRFNPDISPLTTSRSGYGSLVDLTDKASKLYDEIVAYRKKNEAELATYKRLHAKYKDMEI